MTRRLLLGAAAAAVALGSSTAFAQTAHTGQTHQTGTQAPVIYSGCLKAGSDLATGSTLTPGTSSSTPLSGYVLTNAQLNPNASPTSATPPMAAPPGQSPTTTTPPATPPSTQPGTPPATSSATTPPSTTTPPTSPSATSPASAAGATGAGGQVGVTTPSSTPPSGAAMGAAGTRGGSMYRIVGLQDQELQKFANQQVEIRGVMEHPDTTATTGTTGQPTSSQPASTTTNPATGTSGTTAAVGTSSGSNPQAAAVPTFRATSVRVLSSNCSGGTN